jgi:hypothetical protein
VIRIGPSSVAKGIENAMRVKPFNFFRDNVRHIHLNPLPSHWSTEEVHELLRLCPNLVSLYVVFQTSTGKTLNFFQSLRKWRMCDGGVEIREICLEAVLPSI